MRPDPFRIALRASREIFSHGVLGSKSYAVVRPASTDLRRCPLGCPHGRIAPSRIECVGSPITRSALTSLRVPSPPHASHAPKGELKENCRGSSSGMLVPHLGHAY